MIKQIKYSTMKNIIARHINLSERTLTKETKIYGFRNEKDSLKDDEYAMIGNGLDS